ncbi:MAG: acetyltransferase [Spirosoma sp.]|nr:acetyltransferase [Spirosoma sp.]
MKYMIETERLRLRQLTDGDTPFILELLNSPGWLEFIGDRNVRTEEDATRYLRHGPLKSYETHGFGLSLVELKPGETPIGMCGLLKRDYLEHPDIGYALIPEFMGQGYAFEIASATIAYATQTLNIPIVLATVLPTNEKSIRLLEKIGLAFLRTITAPQDSTELLLYSNQKE